MTPERWRQLTAIFHDPQARDAAERATYRHRFEVFVEGFPSGSPRRTVDSRS